MTRYAIDARTLLRIVTEGIDVHPDHQLVAPNAVRSQALQLLLDQVRAGEITEKQARERHTALTETKIRVLSDRVSRWTSFQVASDPELEKQAKGLVTLAPVTALSKP